MIQGLEKALVDLVRIYSPSGKEGRATAWFGDHLSDLGLSDIRFDSVGNPSGKLKGQGVRVTLCGHIDTVPGRLPVKLDNGELSGRGAVDAKSSLIALLYGSLIAKDKGFQGTLNVVASVGEEGPGKGIMEIASTHEKADFAILGEPSGTTSVTVGYRGRLLLDAKYSSASFHASAPWMGESALETAIQSWARIKGKYGENREFSKVSVALTSLNGGTADNVTPSKARMIMDVRFPPSVQRSQLYRELKQMVELPEKGGAGSLEVRSYVDPYVSNMKTSLVQAFKGSILEQTGETAKMMFKSGSGDMNHLATIWNIPCVTYGPGNTQLSHTNNEKISISEVIKSSEIVADALVRLEALENRKLEIEPRPSLIREE